MWDNLFFYLVQNVQKFFIIIMYVFFFFFKQKTAYEIMPSLVGSEMCIRDRYLSSAESSDLIMYGIAAKKFGLTLDQHYSSHCENLVSQQLNTLSTKELVELLSLDLVVQQTQSKMLFNIEFIKLMIQTLDQLVLSQWKQKNDKEKKEIEEMFTSYQKICQLQSLKSYNIIFKQITQQTNNADTKSSTKVQNNQQ
eukprot:TRINITY_DN7909_c0_g1_i2.p1 TRINITY_DN7909_c0_g1~~TRINITY_DN7909_c0_g1_i2.p1  ORF type:complete len:195 (-),score=37.68 TRINITY_DN7909_c0_g1_i2:88-672(-)